MSPSQSPRAFNLKKNISTRSSVVDRFNIVDVDVVVVVDVDDVVVVVDVVDVVVVVVVVDVVNVESSPTKICAR